MAWQVYEEADSNAASTVVQCSKTVLSYCICIQTMQSVNMMCLSLTPTNNASTDYENPVKRTNTDILAEC